MKKLKLGLVGCGKMMATHVSGVKLVDNVEIVAVCDILIENAKEFAEQFGGNPKIYTNYRDMVDDVDAIMIALPHDLHFECGMFFAQHNKHILMEKPLANTEEECIKLIEECEKRNLKLMCAYPVPYKPGVVKLKELIDSGEYGEIIQFSAWTEQLTGSNITFDDPLNRHWLLTNRLGGGQLFSHGCHYIDIMLWFLGEPVTGAHVGTRNGTPWMLREGTSAVVMKFENGAIGYHGATWGARGTRLGYDFQIQTEKGLLEYEFDNDEIRLYNGSGEHVPQGHNESHSYTVLWKHSLVSGEHANKQTQHEIKHFVECVLEDKEPMTSGRMALQSLRIIWALYNAEQNNTMADLRGLGFGAVKH
ncbi:MAG: Gfo/Idh/MocA family oxidoreductase [Clostridia bacterium]|nr:Gfo/Idh/MocA family oxidoreductase [Clostridia bacterium]MBQ9798275.1 Gfo/Idh/MocA family oxidoreductase [Clostridia bacterium]